MSGLRGRGSWVVDEDIAERFCRAHNKLIFSTERIASFWALGGERVHARRDNYIVGCGCCMIEQSAEAHVNY